MKKKLAVGFALFPWSLLLAGLLAFAGPEPDRWEVEHAHDGTDITKRVVFVVDVSGSMRGSPLDYAINAVAHVMTSFPDEGWIKVVCFSDESDVFDASDLPGLGEDEKDADGYIALPNAEAVAAIHTWLYTKGSAGNTLVFPALERAIRENPQEDRSLALVSDFDFNGYDDAHRAVFKKLFEAEKGVPFHCIGINPGTEETALMLWVAKTSNGECVVLRPPATALPEPTPH